MSADRFRSPQHAEAFYASYKATLALWPVPHDELDVDTHFGKTHINAAGSPQSPPIVLIHGAQTSSTAWYANVAALSQRFRVYALDVIDQAGKSRPTRKLANPLDCADWLTDVLDSLHIGRTTLIGHSHGGWQSINFAIRSPQRMDRLVLLSPAGITRLKAEIFLRLLPVFIIPTKRMFYRSFQWATVKPLNIDHPEPVIDQIMQGGTSFKSNELSLGVVTMFDDADLQRIDAPTLLLVGDREKIFDPNQLLSRARRLIPHLDLDLVANAGHLLPIDQADVVNTRILTFLT